MFRVKFSIAFASSIGIIQPISSICFQMLVAQYRTILSIKLLSLTLGIIGLSVSARHMYQSAQPLATDVLLLDTLIDSGTITQALQTLQGHNTDGQVAVIAGLPQPGRLVPATQRHDTSTQHIIKQAILFSHPTTTLQQLKTFADKHKKAGQQLWHMQNGQLVRTSGAPRRPVLPKTYGEIMLLLSILLVALGVTW